VSICHYAATQTGPEQRTDRRFRWSEPVWWARQGSNL
jgi:hypothetical protein